MNIKNHPELMIFCKNVVFLRRVHQLTEAKMAKIMEISIKSLRQLEQGNVPPRLSLTALLGLQAHFLLPPSAFFLPLYPE